MKRRFGQIILIFSIISFFVIGSAIAETVTLTAASGGTGGTWFGQMAAISKLIQEEEPDIVLKTVPGAGLANVVRVNNNEAQIAWSMPIINRWAVKGEDPFKKTNPNVRGIAVGFTLHPCRFYAIRDAGIDSLEQIAEKKLPINLVVSTRGRADEKLGRMMLDYYGISYDSIKKSGGRIMHLEYMDQSKKIKDGQADILFHMWPVPSSFIQEIVLTTPMKSLPQDPELAKVFADKYGFATTTISPGLYKQKVVDVEYTTPAVDLALIVNKDIDDDIVYRITKAICENEAKIHSISSRFKTFAAKKAGNVKLIGVPLHPGAEKYYREKGYIQ